MKERKPNEPVLPMDAHSTPPKDGASLGPDIRDRIARDLRTMWDDVVREGVPPHFVDFLDRLEKQAAKPANPGGNSNDSDPRPSGTKDEKDSR
jgi:hypothetical protein